MFILERHLLFSSTVVLKDNSQPPVLWRKVDMSITALHMDTWCLSLSAPGT